MLNTHIEDVEYNEIYQQFICIVKKKAFVTPDGIYHSITRDDPKSENWTCHNRECSIHKTCKRKCGKCGNYD